MSTSPSSSTSPRSPARSNAAQRLPELFARETQLFGWQGLTAITPQDWTLRSFSGAHDKGNLRLVDDDGLRLEILWEKPRAGADVAKSIEVFLSGLEKEAKKKKKAFRRADHPHLVDKKGRNRPQLVNFGWIGEADDPTASQGWGSAWECGQCGRVVVAHVVGRRGEATGKVQRLAGEVLSSLECHGSGGWETWSVFGLRLEVPEEFQLGRAKLLTGRLEIEWLRSTKVSSMLPVPIWLKRDQRIAVQRVSAANVLLEQETLEDWIVRTLSHADKKRRYQAPQSTSIHDHEAFIRRGGPRDLRLRMAEWIATRWLKKSAPAIEMRVWHCEQSNKIFVLENEVVPANAHVPADVLDSLACH